MQFYRSKKPGAHCNSPPDDVREVHAADKVLRDRHRPLEVQHAVPPAHGHEDDLPGRHDALQRPRLSPRRVALLRGAKPRVLFRVAITCFTQIHTMTCTGCRRGGEGGGHSLPDGVAINCFKTLQGLTLRFVCVAIVIFRTILTG